MIDNQDIERLKSRIRIEDVISKMGFSLTRKGTRHYCLCPFHEDHNPSLIIDTKKNTFYCPVCHTGGDAIRFVMKVEGKSYVEALRYIAGIYGMELRETSSDLSAEQKRQQDFKEMIRTQREAIVSIAHEHLFEEGNEAHAYLRSRGFSDDTLRLFHVGHFPQLSACGRHQEALQKSYDAKQIQGRIVFPWYSASNALVGLAGRVVDVRTKGVQLKYVNSSEKSGFVKGLNLFGINLATRAMARERKVFVVEGYTDAMAMHQSGIENVVAQCGTAMTDAQASILARYADEVVLCLDNDSAGIRAMDMAALKLLPLGVRVEILLAPDGCDPADLLHSNGEDAVLRWSQTDTHSLLDICLDRFRQASVLNPYHRRAALSKLISYLSLIKDSILRNMYIEKCVDVCPWLKAEELGM
ncbi:MAG: DNA primase [Prevotellaceae bacterium]|nr:DNA primase [Candidatus Minthosoma caballi]